ncbi:MAG: hypothetical protein REI12_14970 [Pedobacter sp.]|nr:hypothetical protein [Pedobacter sp.]
MKQKGMWLAVLLLALMLAAIMLGRFLREDAPAQISGVAAAPAQAGQHKPVAIDERPDFASVMEWQVLQGVAAQHAEPEKELQRLVEKLRFSKQQEAWQQIRGQEKSPESTQRHALAVALLADIPARLKAGDMDKSAALRLQQELLADVVSDPASRSARAAAEAARLESVVLQAQP